MQLSRQTRIALRVATAAILTFIYVPIVIIVLFSFNTSRVATWPISGFTLEWYQKALSDPGIRNALSGVARRGDRGHGGLAARSGP